MPEIGHGGTATIERVIMSIAVYAIDASESSQQPYGFKDAGYVPKIIDDVGRRQLSESS